MILTFVSPFKSQLLIFTGLHAFYVLNILFNDICFYCTAKWVCKIEEGIRVIIKAGNEFVHDVYQL
jgi:uncharacterized membrane protein